MGISIHALRGEGDIYDGDHGGDHWKRFQSTPSVGRATALLSVIILNTVYFNPRPPWGGRPDKAELINKINKHFNPRPPWGGRHIF